MLRSRLFLSGYRTVAPLVVLLLSQGCQDQLTAPSEPHSARLSLDAAGSGTATVSTDKADYQPGDTVFISGRGWRPAEEVLLELVRAPAGGSADSLYTTADDEGVIASSDYVVGEADRDQVFTLTATGQSSGRAAQTTFTDGPAEKLVFSGGPLAVSAGQCSGGRFVRRVDVNGRDVPEPSPMTVTMSSSSSSGTFYTDAFCSAAVSTLTIPGGQAVVGFNYKDSNAGSVTITASAPGVTSASLGGTISGPASALSFSGFLPNMYGQACVSGSISRIDAEGKTATAPTNTTIQLTSTPPAGVFYNTALCNTPITAIQLGAASTSTNLWFRPSTTGTTTLTATTAGLSPGTHTATIWPPATKLAFTTPVSAQAGQCSNQVRISSLDATGAATLLPFEIGVSLTTTSGGQFYSNSTCTTRIPGVPIQQATSSADFYYMDPTVGAPTLTASGGSLTPATTVATISTSVQLTTTAVTTQPAGSTYGQPLTISTTVTPAGGTAVPTGGVSFYEGTTCASPSVPLGSGPVTLSGGTATLSIAMLAAGERKLTACYAGSSGFQPSSGTATHTVNKAPLTITAGDATMEYGDPLPGFGATYGGFVLDEGPQALQGTLTFSTPATSASPVSGSPYPITPGGLTSANYNITVADGEITVTKATITVTADNSTRVYGEANPTFTGTLAGIKNQDDIGARYVAGGGALVTAATPVGSYAIVPTLDDPRGALANYTVTPTNGTLTITPRPLFVAAENKTMFYGAQQPPSFTVAYAGWSPLLAEGPSVLAGTLGFTGAATSAGPATPVNGKPGYDIMPGGLSSPNYAITFVPAKLFLVYNTAAGHQFLQPINPNLTIGNRSSFKIGSTIPAKFQLFKADGVTPVTTAVGRLMVFFVDPTPDNPINEEVLTLPPDTGDLFKVTGDQYHYNIGTKGWQAGTYRITAQLEDGSEVSATIDGRSK